MRQIQIIQAPLLNDGPWSEPQEAFVGLVLWLYTNVEEPIEVEGQEGLYYRIHFSRLLPVLREAGEYDVASELTGWANNHPPVNYFLLREDTCRVIND